RTRSGGRLSLRAVLAGTLLLLCDPGDQHTATSAQHRAEAEDREAAGFGEVVDFPAQCLLAEQELRDGFGAAKQVVGKISMSGVIWTDIQSVGLCSLDHGVSSELDAWPWWFGAGPTGCQRSFEGNPLNASQFNQLARE